MRLRPFVNHFQDDWAYLLLALDAAESALIHESTELTSHIIEYGQKPRLDFNWIQMSDSSRQNVQKRITREQIREHLRCIDKAVSWARMNIILTQIQYTH